MNDSYNSNKLTKSRRVGVPSGIFGRVYGRHIRPAWLMIFGDFGSFGLLVKS